MGDLARRKRIKEKADTNQNVIHFYQTPSLGKEKKLKAFRKQS
jgi:hypothetical protein